MRIITCAGYYGTGSSAITDLISEYDDVYSCTEYEFRFVHDPDGISDLEYNLVENPNRHNSGFALKRYKKLVDFHAGILGVKRYEKFFNDQWKETSYRYIDDLMDFKYKGWWQYDLYSKGLFFYYRKLFINKLLKLTLWRNSERQRDVLPKEYTYFSMPGEEKFLLLTKNYISGLFQAANKTKAGNIMVDQIVPPTNIERYLRYFNDIFVFIVDRDPRDVFLTEKCIYKGKSIPTNDVDVFCKWYRATRIHRKTEKIQRSNVCFIQFEDLIYNYEKTMHLIENKLGFDQSIHVNKGRLFKPDDSIKNTKLWNKFKGYEKEMKIIGEELKEYLYDFSQ